MTAYAKRTQVAIRVTQEIVARADALIDAVTELRAAQATRTDVLREAIARGLRELEAEERTP